MPALLARVGVIAMRRANIVPADSRGQMRAREIELAEQAHLPGETVDQG